MHFLEIQKFLAAGGTLDQLREQYKLVITEEDDGRVMFNYDQIESSKGEIIAQESRGLILEKNTWKVVALGFHRFFNYGEGFAAIQDVDFAPGNTNEFGITEKFDGSYVSLYYYNGMWRWSTRGSIKASGSVGDCPFTFQELIQRASKATKMPVCFDCDGVYMKYTFIFELTSPYNKIVTNYDGISLRLIGIRHKETGVEISCSELQHWVGFLGVTSFQPIPIASVTSVLDLIAKLPPTEEGFVLFKYTNSAQDGRVGIPRIKIKNPSYVALHHLKTSDSVKNLATILQKGEEAEVSILLPEYKEILKLGKDKLEECRLLFTQQFAYAMAEANLQQDVKAKKKAFATLALQSRMSGYLFKKYAKPELSFQDIIKEEASDKLALLLELERFKEEAFKPHLLALPPV